MSHWVKKPLNAICVVDWGNTSLTKKAYEPSGQYLAVSAAGCDGRIGHAEHKAFTPVLSAIGAQCGRIFWPEEDFTAIKNTITLTPKVDESDSRFLFHLLEHIELPKRGAAQPFMSKGDISAFSVPVPPLSVQKRIAAILDAADALRAKRRESIEQLDSLVQATFLEMFGDPATNPKGWPITCLRHIANDTFRNGLSPSTKGSVAGQVLTLGAITSGAFLFAERKSACFDRSPAEAQTLSERTFLICRGNGNRELVGVGAFPDRTSTDVCFPDTMIGVTPDCGIVHGRYLHRMWNSRCVRTQVEGMARTTNGTYKVNQQMLATVAMPLPPLTLQTRFASIVESIEQQKARLKAHLAELDTLFASLQSRAFNGELVA